MDLMHVTGPHRTFPALQRRHLPCLSIFSGSHTSSASKNAIQSPELAAMPSLRATDTPAFGWWIYLTRGRSRPQRQGCHR